MYKVTEIIEQDFGCEGLPDGQEPMCEVVLQSDDGKQITICVSDKELYTKEISEGQMIDYTDGIITKVGQYELYYTIRNYKSSNTNCL